MKKFIISIDAGTTSNRAILFDLKGKPIPISFNKEHKTVQDSYELGSRDYWTEKDEQDLAEGKMSKAEVKKPKAEAAPEAGGITISFIPSFFAT